MPWVRVGGLSALTVLGFAVAASSAQVSGQAVVPVPVPMVSAATPQAEVGELNLVTVVRPPTQYRIAPSAAIAPPPPGIVMAPGGLGIPKIALEAYQNAEKMMAKAAPGCGVSWNLLAGIGRIESGHANNGATDVKGRVVQPIYGPSLDGTLPGNEVIVDHEQTRTQGAQVYVRAIGPMQFLPSTWSRYASDGDGDGKADPQNVFDASLAAARYLCSGGLNLRDRSQTMSAILRYNNSVAYAQNVLAWAAGYATGVIPLNLPPLTAADVAPERKAHLGGGESRGLGPGSVTDVAGLSPNDPLAQLPIVNPLTPDRAVIAACREPSRPRPRRPRHHACSSAPRRHLRPNHSTPSRRSPRPSRSTRSPPTRHHSRSTRLPRRHPRSSWDRRPDPHPHRQHRGRKRHALDSGSDIRAHHGRAQRTRRGYRP